MTTPAERARAIVEGMLERDAFSQWLGVAVIDVRPAACTLWMRVREEMANGFGTAHGGIVFSLADSALAFASNTHGQVTVSIENGITYPAPIQVGDELTAIAEQESETARLAFFRVTVRNQDGTVVGLFRGTVYRTQKPHG